MRVPVTPGRWPLIGHTPAMPRRRFRFTGSLHDHGDLVKLYLGPLETYFVTSPELTHQVLVADAASYRKGIMFDRFTPFLGNGLVMSNGAFHLRQRRLMQPAFHREHIARYTEIMVRAAEDLIGAWQPGEVRQVDHDMQSVAVTVVGEEVPKGAFIPFGAGTRQCIGNSFAITEITVVLATVAARWRLVPVPDQPVRVKFTSAAYPSRLPMTAVPRN
jgi:cytochrome P450